MTKLRQAIGPLLIGLAAWCAAGSLAVVDAAQPAARLGAMAPWWVWLVGAALAAAVPAWRTRPLTTLPAALAIVPWLPLPVPAPFLIFVGPMAWAPLVLALGLGIGLAPVRWMLWLEPDDAVVAAMVLAGAVAGVTAWSLAPNGPTGDEPHYLIIAQSLLQDGDLNIDNQHADRSYQSFFSGELNPDLRRRGLHGEAYSIHAPGVPALVAPMFRLFGYNGVKLLLGLLSAIGAMLIWRLSWRATNSVAAAWFAWAAVVLTPTFALQSITVFPDGPGLLAVAVPTLLLVQLARRDTPGHLPIFLTGVALAALPWLHTRFAILAAGFGLALTLRMLAMDVAWRGRVTRLIAFLGVPAISAALWLLLFKLMYGTFDPRAPYPPEEQELAWIGPAILGLFFDGQYGLAAYAPAVALAWVGWCRKPAEMSRRLLVELGLIALVYLAAVTTVRMWWAGKPAPPARFLMALLPMLAVPLAVCWDRASAKLRALAAGLAGAGALVTWCVVVRDHAALASNYRDAQAVWLGWLSPLVNLRRVWPEFFWDEPRFPLHVAIVLGVLALLWLVIARWARLAPRATVVAWIVAALVVVAPISWTLTHAKVIDPANAQFDVVRDAGRGRALVAINGAIGGVRGGVHRLSAFPQALRIAALEPGVMDPPPLLFLSDVPAARYVVSVQSQSAFPTSVRVSLGSSAVWRELPVPGAGTFTFPLTIPAGANAVLFDVDADRRPLLSVSLGVERALAAAPVPMRRAAHFGSADVLFLDDNAFVEPSGFWVRGKDAAQFVLVPETSGLARVLDAPGTAATPPAVRLLVRNGAKPNQISVESGTYQRLLVMNPGEEQDLLIPTGADGTARVRVASGDGFVPAEVDKSSTDRRLLGAWIEIWKDSKF